MKYASKAREKIIQAMIDSLSEDRIPWARPWHMSEFYNPSNGHQYQGGVNLMILNYFANKNDYADPRWMTFKQAQEKGWHIKAGEHGVLIEFWSAYHAVTKKKLAMSEVNELLKVDKNAKDYIRFVAKSYTVFNAQQIVGIPELPLRSVIERTDTLVRVEGIRQGMGVHQKVGTQAFYIPDRDCVVLPPMHTFDNGQAYCATFLHELAHATGHETRLNRNIKNAFGTPAYAKEELRAEIASAFMMGMLEIGYDEKHLDNHKAYIASWIELLQKEPEELFKAIKDAEKVQEYMVEMCPEQIKETSIHNEDYGLENQITREKDTMELDM